MNNIVIIMLKRASYKILQLQWRLSRDVPPLKIFRFITRGKSRETIPLRTRMWYFFNTYRSVCIPIRWL